MFALSEILDAPWARAALSEQFNVWRGNDPEWKLYLPGPWPVQNWSEPPGGELVVEGTDTIRSLIGGEEWRVFTREPGPLLTLVQDFPRFGHWDEDEEAEAFAPFLQEGARLLHLDAGRFEVDTAGTVQFRPSGLVELPEAELQTLIDLRPRNFKSRSPRSSGWTPTWQLLWLWIEAARTFWATHFVNPVASLDRPYSKMPPPDTSPGLSSTPSEPSPVGSVQVGLRRFFERCSERQWPAQVRLSLQSGRWQARLAVLCPTLQVEPAVQIRQIAELAHEAGLAAFLVGKPWNSGWSLQRNGPGEERWLFEAQSAPLAVETVATLLEGHP